MFSRIILFPVFAALFFAADAVAQNGSFQDLLASAPVLGSEDRFRIPVPATAALPDDTVREMPPRTKEVPPPAPIRPSGFLLRPADLSAFDPDSVLPANLKAATLEYFLANQEQIGNLRYIGVVDFTPHSSVARFYIADISQGAVRVLHVAHGAGSDPDNDGYPTSFSNEPGSEASSLGFYLTGEIYYGKHGRSMRLHGLSPTNSNAYARAVVLHGAEYVSDENIQPGRSWGCLSVSVASVGDVIDMLQGGALIYAGLSGS